jgi:glutamate-1-semialdehyde 2,1-aminomutase
MNELLQHLERPEVRAAYRDLDAVWDGRARYLNERLSVGGFPVRVANLASVWTTLYTEPGRYHWMFQYYLRAEGLWPSWVGTGRFIFSHDLTDDAFREIADRFVTAAGAMRADGWWWRDASLTRAKIQRRVLGELIRAALLPRGRGPSDRSALP